MTRSISVSLYLAILSLTSLQASSYTFIECTDIYKYKPQPDDPKAHYAGGTSAGCATYCSSLNTPYFYNQYNTGTCYCSSVTPSANQYTYGSGDQAGCEGSDYEIYAMKDPIMSFKLEGCYTTVTTSQHPGNKPTLEACFASCPSSKSVIFSPDSDTNTFDCKCDPGSNINSSGGGTTTCGEYAWFAYSRSLSKRRMEGKRRLDKQMAFDQHEKECREEEEDTNDTLSDLTNVVVETVIEEIGC
ncbi:hypothetical protein I203_100396 [Kwoniella mangroviensis CBS 8507]|uniref:uncharacterized protein n=1 Tax=Kwoniella mangroviensis CBS 8507 TaxID=1296122 RepID=UPI00080CE3A5|nr:uncharacterized protein I203_05733 [Kwoniella mangroviensis CBS 8507]OCF64991.1 hypothetical protein I203_05733 [Kwoniella mangroviensis CBS 8507]